MMCEDCAWQLACKKKLRGVPFLLQNGAETADAHACLSTAVPHLHTPLTCGHSAGELGRSSLGSSSGSSNRTEEVELIRDAEDLLRNAGAQLPKQPKRASGL